MTVYTLGKRLNKQLFKNAKRNRWNNRYALTLSLCPNQRIGRKMWKNHDMNYQIQYLEDKLTEKANENDFHIIRHVIEVGPNNGCRHLHALIETDDPVIPWFDHTVKKYKPLDVRPVYDYCGWDEYMNKDENIIADNIIPIDYAIDIQTECDSRGLQESRLYEDFREESQESYEKKCED